MARSLSLLSISLITVLAVTGCHNGSPVVDPFLAPQRVPPPPTGQPAAGLSQPYYQGAPPPGTPVPGATFPGTTPGGMIPPADSYSPAVVPGGVGQSISAPAAAQQQVVRFDDQVRLAAAESPASTVRIPDDPPIQAAPIVNAKGAPVEPNRLTLPQTAATGRPPSLSQQLFTPPPVRTQTTDPAFATNPALQPRSPNDLNIVPRAPTSYAQPATGQGEYRSVLAVNQPPSNVQPVGGTMPIPRAPNYVAPTYAAPAAGAPRGEQPPQLAQAPRQAVEITELPPAGSIRAPVARAAPAPPISAVAHEVPRKLPSPPVARYGYQTEYSWLKGKLERSRSTGEWKLRYIPIDGDTDRYGGSVVIDNADAIADFQPGDFVAIAGRIGSTSDDSGGFAPTYVVQRIKPLVE